MPASEQLRGPTRFFGLPSRVAAGFGVAVLALLVAGGALTYAFAERRARGDAMGRSWATLNAVHELEASVVISATTVDTYAVTGERTHRARHLRAVGATMNALTRLEEAIGAAPAQAANVERLGRLVRAIQTHEARLVGRRDRGKVRPDDRSIVWIRSALEELHAIVDEILEAEAASAAAKEAAWRSTVRLTNLVAAGAALALLILIGGAARAVRQDTERRDREDAERARLFELQQRMMAMVGHDLRTPLSGIKWNAALLARSGLDSANLGHVRRISASGKRMERLIRDMLDYGRVHAGAGLPVAPEAGDLVAICREAVEELQDAQHRIALSAEGDASGVWDADRVEQIVANLVHNALKHGPPGRPVSVRVVGEPDAVRIEVHDEGGGIPPSVVSWLFEPYRVRGIPRKGSVGLGLFIVRTLVEAHGGTVSVDSAPERGTTFAVRLPRAGVPRAAVVAR